MKFKKLERIKAGEKLYDNFLIKIFGIDRLKIVISNPRTNTLELFYFLSKDKTHKYLLIGAMCAELAQDQNNENVFVENGRLCEHKMITTLIE